MTTPSNLAMFWTKSIKVLPEDHYSTTQSVCDIFYDADEANTVEPDEIIFLDSTDSEIPRSEVIETIDCHHSFHSQCLHVWLQCLATDGREGTCPKCRHVIVRSHAINFQVRRRDSDIVSRLEAAIEHFNHLRREFAETRRQNRESRLQWAGFTVNIHQMNRDEADIERIMEEGRMALNVLATQLSAPPLASLAPSEPLTPSSGLTSAGRTHRSPQPVPDHSAAAFGLAYQSRISRPEQGRPSDPGTARPMSTDVVGQDTRGATESEDACGSERS
ncbi:hypothetical protein BKA63DRAFT_582979 [Paraphoma chrysanthemicola]|nr:hypothetical protein BKA63DRAFT_582979 [Paraphoma chrysanthemicola]